MCSFLSISDLPYEHLGLIQAFNGVCFPTIAEA